ncbi:MAG TPA: hypothetical protein EYQ58_06290 [Candidatus Poseidoniales archaeon]|nr:MAG: hypothetical protein CXT70_01095 [Euryarchaeota archaeon]HIF91122.1 hypothetical protein [Candidatus Poseidoniales archaeon]
MRAESKSTSLAILFILILLSSIIPLASAGLTDSTNGGRLFLACDDIENCSLSSTAATGEEMISQDVMATPGQAKEITLEFEMEPRQKELALLPDILDEMVIDLRLREDATGWTRPELDISLIIGNSVTDWNFPAQNVPSQTANEPYMMSDETLDLQNDRLLWAGQNVRLRLTFTIDRPSTWELHLWGNSFLELTIPWSQNIDDANIDEPSSDSNPIDTEFETVHYGALVESDRDCWEFDVEEHELLKVILVWEPVPIEIEQSHGLPDLITPNGRLAGQPEIIIEEDDEETRVSYRWRALPIGQYHFCIGGKAGAFQPYYWAGLLGFEGMGPIDPSSFESESYYPAGSAIIDDSETAINLQRSNSPILILSILSFLGFGFGALRLTTSAAVRFGLFTPGVILLLFGGIISPVWALADEVQLEGEISFDDMVDMRLQQLWDISYPGVPQQTLVEHTGSTWGMLDGENFKLRLNVEKAYPLENGRYQLLIPELQSFRLDEAIFSQVAKGGSQTTDEGMLEQQTVRFILLAGRSMLLDFLMMEALMIVDEEPSSSIFHLDVDMVETSSTGAVSVPAWGTRPSFISESEWSKLQFALFPERISITLCDCELDLLDVRFTPSDGFDLADIPDAILIRNASGLMDSSVYIAGFGFVLCLVATRIEFVRINTARELAQEMFVQSKWD